MHHRRFLAVASALALPLTLFMPPPALASTVVTTLPPDWGWESFTCLNDPGSGTVHTEPGPGTPPAGTGSLQLRAPAEEQTYVMHEVGQLSQLQGWDLGLRTDGGAAPALLIYLPDNNHQLVAQPSLPDNTWTSLDAYGLVYDLWDMGGSLGPTTLPEYVGTHPDSIAYLVTFASACTPLTGGTVNLDEYGWTSSGFLTSYDFEPGTETSASISASRSTITAGGSTTLATRLMQGAAPIGGADVDLYARTAGASAFAKVGTATTGGDGRASLVVKPMKNTTYQWRYGGDLAESATKAVKVRARVTLSLADSTLRKGQTLVAKGKVTPAKGGHPATLWRVTSSGRDKLATGLIAATGAYKLSKAVTRAGTWKVVVTVPAVDGNAAGTSPVRKATVR